MRKTKSSPVIKQRGRQWTRKTTLLLLVVATTTTCDLLLYMKHVSRWDYRQQRRALQQPSVTAPSTSWRVSSSTYQPAKHLATVEEDRLCHYSFQVPSFIIAGAQKSGTTALQAILRQHPNLQSSHRPEAHFFDRHGAVRDHREAILTWYQDIHKKSKNSQTWKKNETNLLCQIRQAYWQTHFAPVSSLSKDENYNNIALTFEKTPSYLLDPKLPRIIRTIAPWTKIVVALRHPVDRILSQYHMRLERQQQGDTNSNYLNNQTNTPTSLEDLLSAELLFFRRTGVLDLPKPVPFDAFQHRTVAPLSSRHWRERSMLYRGCYAMQLEPWLREYTLKEDLLVIPYETTWGSATVGTILGFCRAPPHIFPEHVWQTRDAPFRLQQNQSHHYDNRQSKWQVSNRTRDYLERFYRHCNRNLASLLGEEKWQGVWWDGPTTTMKR